MSIVDLHPEELLDRHARGVLTSTERARLEAHVTTCVVCRFELAARLHFMDDGATETAPPGVFPLPAPLEPTMTLVPNRRRRRAWVFGLAAALIGGISFAALSMELLGARATRTVEGVPSHAASQSPEGRALAVATQPSANTTNGTSPAPPAIDTPLPAAAHADRGAVNGATHPLRALQSASELFRAANGARRSGDVEHAMGLYKELEARYPKSEEARVSYATLGSLLLDRGDARSALDGFNQYLSRGSGALGEEALVGRALAFQRLGAHDGEVAAWQEILRRFPDSVHARLARSRLVELGQR